MNKGIYIIPVVAVIAVALGSLVLLPAADTNMLSTQSSSDNISEQQRVNNELLERGLVFHDDKWWDPEILAEQNNLGEDGVNYPLQLGGWLTLTHYDKDRNPISTQTIHNRVVNQGEDFLIDQVFREGQAGETADADQLASICVTLEAGFVDTSETETAATFDTDDGLTSTNCITDTSVTQTSQTAVIGALTFDAPTHVPNSSTITGIAICQGSGTTPFNQCQDAQASSSGILWSVINIADVTLAASETVDITYTADFSSAGS